MLTDKEVHSQVITDQEVHTQVMPQSGTGLEVIYGWPTSNTVSKLLSGVVG